MKNKTRKNLLAIAGIISTIFGITGTIPSFLKENYSLAIGSSILVIGGIILLAIAFGD